MPKEQDARNDATASQTARMPAWLPQAARSYIEHTSHGHSIREIARRRGCHASTILRHIQKIELRRDDPLVDAAIDAIGREDGMELQAVPKLAAPVKKSAPEKPGADNKRISAEARRVLRRLCEAGSFLAVSQEMDRAIVMREGHGGTTRTAVLDKDIAHSFALREWIACEKAGRIACYRITSIGRAALKRMIADEQARQLEASEPQGFAEAPAAFGEQHREYGERWVMATDGSGAKRHRYNLAESPITVLGRKLGRDGAPFLNQLQIEAGERLREDFELAQMGPRVAQNWDRFLTGGDRSGMRGGSSMAEGPADARRRVALALDELGPGLSDVALRVCCFLEGLEAAEKTLGWSARSGKVVLRIALDRLALHYGLGARETRQVG